MTNECSIVRDLLPLYAEHMTSKETDQFILQHLETCTECTEALQSLNENIPILAEEEEPVPLQKLSVKYKKNMMENILAAVCIVLSCLLALFSWLTKPQYLSYQDAVESIAEKDDGVLITFTDQVYHYDTQSYTFADENISNIDLSCWTTVLDQMWGSSPSYTAVLSAQNIWYKPNRMIGNTVNEQEDVLIYGDETSHAVSLRRLALNFYVWLTAGASAVLLILCLFTKNRTVFKLFLLPLSWLCAHIIVEQGLAGATFHLTRDFCLICLLTVTLYGSCLLVYRRYLKKVSVPAD